MKRSILGTLLSIIVFGAGMANADVKVKSKQTISGQIYESSTYIKGKRQRSESFGGMISIIQCDLKRNLQINQNSRTYLVRPFAATAQAVTRPGQPSVDKDGVIQSGGNITTTVTTRDTGERKQMFGYTARRLIITIETISSPDACSKANTKMQTDGWYIDAAFALDCDYAGGAYSANYGKKGGCQDRYSVKTVGAAKRGFAVYEKMTMFDEAGREMTTMTTEVVEFSQATLDASLFDAPAGYREVNDPSQMYATATAQSSPSTSGLSALITNADDLRPSAITKTDGSAAAGTIGPKKPGVVRIGIPAVKTGSVGDGVSAADLSAAVRNSMIQYLKAPNVEVIALEAKLDSAVETEARSKDCDLVAYLTVSHKKGGGGFGMFKSLAPMIGNVIPAAGASGSGGYIAGQAVATAATLSVQVRNKDEITLQLRLNKADGNPSIERAAKAKARSNGDDIVSEVVGHVAEAIIGSVGQR